MWWMKSSVVRAAFAVALGVFSCVPAGAASAQASDSLPGGPPAKAPASAPFAFADFSWVPGNAGPSERPLTWGPFTGEFRLDDVFHYSFARPIDNTISGSSEV